MKKGELGVWEEDTVGTLERIRKDLGRTEGGVVRNKVQNVGRNYGGLVGKKIKELETKLKAGL